MSSGEGATDNAAVRMRGAGADDRGDVGRVLPVVAVVLAGVLQLVVTWFTAVSGLVAPLWAIVVLAVLWLAATALLVIVARRRPLAAPLVPLANGLLWWASMAAGQTWLGWTP